MGILGRAGSLYMMILIALLIIGFGLTGLWLIDTAFGLNKKTPGPKANAANKLNPKVK